MNRNKLTPEAKQAFKKSAAKKKFERARNAETNAKIDADEVIEQMAALDKIEYDRRRVQTAANLGIRMVTLDDRVSAKRAMSGNISNNIELFDEPEPWQERVSGTKLLDDLVAAINKYTVVPKFAAYALALWVLFAHAHDAFAISPIACVMSPEKRCGKTKLMGLLSDLVPRSLPTTNITGAAMFRIIDECAPTLLIDEADSFMGLSEDLRNILNSGHARKAYVYRCVGDDHKVKRFSTWTPKGIALIGKLHPTLADRSIKIFMQRKLPGEIVARMRVGDDPLLDTRRRAIRWAADNIDALRDSDPEAPDGLHDRARDNWQPLLAIADQIGGEWPERARISATRMESEIEDDSAAIMLLQDIEDIFATRQVGRTSSKALCEELASIEARPWPEWKLGKPITPAQLAKLLSPFGIRPRQVSINGTNRQGYRIEQFEDAFARYLSNEAPRPLDPNKTAAFSPKRGPRRKKSIGARKRRKANQSAASRGLGGNSGKVRRNELVHGPRTRAQVLARANQAGD